MHDGAAIRQDYADPIILLVEDERQFRVAMRKHLAVRGYNIVDVDNGKDAVKLVRRPARLVYNGDSSGRISGHSGGGQIFMIGNTWI